MGSVGYCITGVTTRNTLYVKYIVNEMMIYELSLYIVLINADTLVDKVPPRYQPSSARLYTPRGTKQNIPTHLLNTSHLSQQIRFYSSKTIDSLANASVASPEDSGLEPPNSSKSDDSKLQIKPRTELIRRLSFKGPLGRPRSDPISIAYNNKLAMSIDLETPKIVKILPTVQRFTKSPWTGHRAVSFHKDSLLVLKEEDSKSVKSETQDPSWGQIYLSKIEELKTAKREYKRHIEKKLIQQDNSSRDDSVRDEQLLRNVNNAYAAAELALDQAKQQKPMPVDETKLLENQPLLPLQPLSQLTQSILKEQREAAKQSDNKKLENGAESLPFESATRNSSALLVRKSGRFAEVRASNITGFRYPIVEESGKTKLADTDLLEKGEELTPFKIARTRRSNLPYRNPSQLIQSSTPKLSDSQIPMVEEIKETQAHKSGLEDKFQPFGRAPMMMRKPDSASAKPKKPKTVYVKMNDPVAIVPQPLDERWTVVDRELLTAGTSLLWKHFPEHFGPNGEQLKPFHPIIERSISSSPLSRFRIVESIVSSHPLLTDKAKPMFEPQKGGVSRSTGNNIRFKSVLDSSPFPKPGPIEPGKLMSGSPLPTVKRAVSTAAVSSPRLFSTSSSIAQPKLTHLTPSGSAHMVDIAAKGITSRTAVAVCNIYFSNSDVLPLIKTNQMKKGDVLGVARIAGIMAAKKTSDLIPLCHPIAITNATVELEIHEPKPVDDKTPREFGNIEIVASVSCDGKTGVEMEALTACSSAALTVYDMCKAVDKGMRIENLRVVRKSGGRSGDFVEGSSKD